MADVLLAIARGLAGIPGLAPVFNPLISLRQEETAARANEALLQKISEGHEVSREALDDILVGIREHNQAMRQQMVCGFYAVLKLMRKQDPGGMPKQHQQPSTSTTNIEQQISTLIEGNKAFLANQGLVTRDSLRDELVRLFSDEVRTLLAIAQPAGFPRGWVSTRVTPIEAYYQFLETCEGLERPQIAQIAQALVRKKPGSALLRAWAIMYS